MVEHCPFKAGDLGSSPSRLSFFQIELAKSHEEHEPPSLFSRTLLLIVKL